VRRVPLEVRHEKRTWSDQTHLAAENVDQFGQLVEAPVTQSLPNRVEPLHIREEMAVCAIPFSHRSELEDREGFAAESRALLAKENWPTQRCQDHNDDNCEERGERDQDGENQHNVESSLAKRAVRAHGFGLLELLEAR
jgi:hypothetical protein